MIKKIKRVGKGVCILFNKEEQEIYDITVGDTFEIEIVRIKKKGGKN